MVHWSYFYELRVTSCELRGWAQTGLEDYDANIGSLVQWFSGSLVLFL